MKAKSAKAKGNRYESWLVEDLRKSLDEKTHRTYGSGSGLDKSDVNIPNYDIEIEAKNQKTLKILDWWEQTCRQRTDRMSVLVFRNPRKPEFQENLVIMDYEEWKELIKSQKEETIIESNFDSKLKWKVATLKKWCHEVIKDLE